MLLVYKYCQILIHMELICLSNHRIRLLFKNLILSYVFKQFEVWLNFHLWVRNRNHYSWFMLYCVCLQDFITKLLKNQVDLCSIFQSHAYVITVLSNELLNYHNLDHQTFKEHPIDLHPSFYRSNTCQEIFIVHFLLLNLINLIMSLLYF